MNNDAHEVFTGDVLDQQGKVVLGANTAPVPTAQEVREWPTWGPEQPPKADAPPRTHRKPFAGIFRLSDRTHGRPPAGRHKTA